MQPLFAPNQTIGALPDSIASISLHQPWASLVAVGAKQNETRSWPTNHRGLIAIHATKSTEYLDECRRDEFRLALKQGGYRSSGELPLGCILAIANLRDCIQITLDNQPGEPERSFGDYTPGRWMWRFDNIIRLPTPIPTRGYQAVWRWTVPEGLVV